MIRHGIDVDDKVGFVKRSKYACTYGTWKGTTFKANDN